MYFILFLIFAPFVILLWLGAAIAVYHVWKGFKTGFKGWFD